MGFTLRLNRVGATLLLIVALLTSLVLPHQLWAQEANDAITLSISPQLLEITANPGEVVTNTFRLTNASSETVSIKTTPKNFTPLGEEGAVDLTEDRTNFSLAEWITVSPEEVLLTGSKTQDFVVTIDVPSNVEPGSHFGSVVFQTVPPEDEEAVALVSQEIAPVILVKVAGDITETAEIAEFTASKSFWSNESSVSLVSRVKNTGTAHFKPTGQIVIKNMFGSEVAKFELDKRNVLPESIRQFTNEWQLEGFKVGRYTAELTLVTGEDNNIQTASTSFTVFPYQTIIPIILGIAVIGFILYKGRRRISKAVRVLSGKEELKD